MTAPHARVPSLDDPELMVDTPAKIGRAHV